MTNPPTDERRKAFESFASDRAWPIFRIHGVTVGSPEYEDMFVSCAWIAWKEANARYGEVVKVSDIQSLIDAYNARAKCDPSRADWLAVRYDLTTLISKAEKV